MPTPRTGSSGSSRASRSASCSRPRARTARAGAAAHKMPLGAASAPFGRRDDARSPGRRSGSRASSSPRSSRRIAGTPFSVDMVTAFACQETGEIWPALRRQGLPTSRILELCVGDTIDASATGGRPGLPEEQGRAAGSRPQGDRMFDDRAPGAGRHGGLHPRPIGARHRGPTSSATASASSSSTCSSSRTSPTTSCRAATPTSTWRSPSASAK